jgi:hypothetical protein
LGIDIIPTSSALSTGYIVNAGHNSPHLGVKEYIPADDIIRELDSVLSKSPELDVVTFSELR